MKKILLTTIAAAGCLSAFGQGQVLFENTDNSSGPWVTLNTSGGPQTTSGLVVELLWYNGTSFINEDVFTSTYAGNGSGGQGPGQFKGGQLTIPQSGSQKFEVEGFYTSGPSQYSGTTASFTASVNVSPLGAGVIDNLSAGGWNGDLVLTPVPEPATIALGGLGAAALLLFRRRK
jgi:hypothetical protein